MAPANLHALVIDDDPQVRSLIVSVLISEGWSVAQAANGAEGLARLSEREWGLIFCDVVLGDATGYEVLEKYAETKAGGRFVLMTGHGDAAGALDATALGAYEYLQKPFSIDRVTEISRTVRKRANRSFGRKAADDEQVGYRSDLSLIGKDPKFVDAMKVVGRVASTELPVLITGESGTGKEVVARAIHERSRRAGGPFVPVNCGAIPTELIESELFGHARGSFTGAERERLGLWEQATGGTLFLDEITETSPVFQVKILRALQESEIRRVGSNRNIRVDVRVVAATNRDIDALVREGRFRQDLMYRLNAVVVHLPPLRERGEDIIQLAAHLAEKAGGRHVEFSPEALDCLKHYDWPGNIRELENAVQRAAILSNGVVYPEHLPSRVSKFPGVSDIRSDTKAEPDGSWVPLAEMEKRYIGRVLAHTGGNKQAAARILDIDRKTLTRILDR